MAKIRTLKAEFFRNAGVSRGGLLTKTLAAGLICAVADDDGRFKVKADDLKGEIFTHDAVSVDDVEQALQKLVTEDFIRLYRDHGRTFGVLVSWKSHQPVPPSRYIPSVLPAPPNTNRRRHAPTNRKQSSTDASSRAGVGKERNRKGEEGKGIGEEPPKGSPVGEADALVLVSPKSLTPAEQVFEAWRAMWHPTAKLTRERSAKIEARLREGWSLGDLVEAVTVGAERDPWVERHVALNDDIKNLLRSGSAVEKFLGLAREPASTLPPRKRTLAESYRQQAAALREAGQ